MFSRDWIQIYISYVCELTQSNGARYFSRLIWLLIIPLLNSGLDYIYDHPGWLKPFGTPKFARGSIALGARQSSAVALRAYAIHPPRRKAAIEGGRVIYQIQAAMSRRPPVAVARETYTCPTAPNLGSLLHKQATYTLRDNRAWLGTDHTWTR